MIKFYFTYRIKQNLFKCEFHEGGEEIVMLPFLPIGNKVLFPGAYLKLNIGKKESVELVEQMFGIKSKQKISKAKNIVITTIRDEEWNAVGAGKDDAKGRESTSKDDGEEARLVRQPRSMDVVVGKKTISVYAVGALATVVDIIVASRRDGKTPKHKYTLVVKGERRVNIERADSSKDYVRVKFSAFRDLDTGSQKNGPRRRALAKNIKEQFKSLVDMIRKSSGGGTRSEVGRLKELLDAISSRRLVELGDLITSAMDISTREKQEILAEKDVDKRLERVLKFLTRQVEVMSLSLELNRKVSGEVKDQQRKFYLRQHLKAIKEELGQSEEGPTAEDDVGALQAKLDAAKLTPEAARVAKREMSRLKRIPPQQPEHHVIREYVETLASLPWNAPVDRRKPPLLTTTATVEDRDVATDSIRGSPLSSDTSSEKFDSDVKSTMTTTTTQRVPKPVDIQEASEFLDADHFGLTKVKKRLLEYLAVCALKGDLSAPILCLVGPPGVGKTSLGASVARALDRPFHRISLGGVRDEAEIRGHRRTYIGALPGRILQALRKVKANNPVILLDEVDKLGRSARGDPGAALLELLDPAQNKNFVDSYVAVPFDMSSVLFIATANTMHTIPAPLLDRMETIQIAGYTWAEKVKIAKKHLLPRQLRAHGLSDRHVAFPVPSDDLWRNLAIRYTREAGVRQLDQKLAALCRYVALRLAKWRAGHRVREGGKEDTSVLAIDDVGFAPVLFDKKRLKECLGPAPHSDQRREIAIVGKVPGASIGLAWTPVGGEVLLIEAALMQGTGQIILTGALGDVMRESVRTALSWIRAHEKNLNLSALLRSSPSKSGATASRSSGEPSSMLRRIDLHVHFPAAATPKDGPSAGVTIATALVSLMSGLCPRGDTAMTGELSLLGLVLPVGGIKQKVLAAHRHGIRRLILPSKNRKDMAEVPHEVADDLEVHFAEYFEDVLKFAFNFAEHAELTDLRRRRRKWAAEGDNTYAGSGGIGPLDWLRDIVVQRNDEEEKEEEDGDASFSLSRSFL
eukprot:g2892.t1